MRTKNPRFNRFAIIYSVWCAAMLRRQHTTHQHIFNQSPEFEHGKSRKIPGHMRINKILFFYLHFIIKNMQGQDHVNCIKYNNKQKTIIL